MFDALCSSLLRTRSAPSPLFGFSQLRRLVPAAHALTARIQNWRVNARQFSQTNGLCFLIAAVIHIVHARSPAAAIHFFHHQLLSCQRQCRQALPRMSAAAGDRRKPSARLCETEGRHRDGRSPQAGNPRGAWVCGLHAAREKA